MLPSEYCLAGKCIAHTQYCIRKHQDLAVPAPTKQLTQTHLGVYRRWQSNKVHKQTPPTNTHNNNSAVSSTTLRCHTTIPPGEGGHEATTKQCCSRPPCYMGSCKYTPRCTQGAKPRKTDAKASCDNFCVHVVAYVCSGARKTRLMQAQYPNPQAFSKA